MECHVRGGFFHPPQHVIPHGRHECRLLQGLHDRIHAIQLPSRPVVGRRVAFFADRGEVGRTIGAVAFPEPDMVFVKDGAFLNGAPADNTGMAVPCEYRFPECHEPVLFSVLIILPFGYRKAEFNSFQYLRVKLSHFDVGTLYGHYRAYLTHKIHMPVTPVPDGGRKTVFCDKTLPVVKARFPVTFSVTARPAIFQTVVVFLHLITQKVVLTVHMFVFFGTDRYPDMQVPRILLQFHVLHLTVLAFCKADGEHRAVFFDNGLSLLKKFPCAVPRRRHQ